MKKLLLLLIISITHFYNAQSPTQFEFTSNAMNPFIVTEVQNKSATELYQKSLEWIKKNYKSPDDVIITTVENDYIRFRGIANNLRCWKLVSYACSDVQYETEITFKDGKFKFEILNFEEKDKDPFNDFRTYWKNINALFYTNNKTLYNKDGELKKQYVGYINKIPSYFNNLNSELKSYIEESSQQKNDW